MMYQPYGLLQKALLTCMVSICLLVQAVFFSGCSTGGKNHPDSQGVQTHNCARIVSLSPSITEVLYELDLDKQLVGVTRYCKYPDEAKSKPSVGGYIDPDMETLLRLQPTLVIIRQEQTELVQNVHNLGIPVLKIDHRNVEGVLQSFHQIGEACHKEKQARAHTEYLQASLQAIRQKVQAAEHRPKVMVAVDRDIHSKNIRWVYIAGEDGFFSWMIEQAGGQNVAPPGRRGFLQVSSEGLLRMNPDLIIETLPSIGGTGQGAEKARKQWNSLPQMDAVRNNRIYLFSDDYMVIPGPRFVRILEKFAQAIHPELNWNHDSPLSPAPH